MTNWHGVFSAITTKFADVDTVDLSAMRKDVAFQIEGGVHGIICCGSLGEASTLTADEKIAIAEAVKREAAGRVPVLLTIAEDSTAAACALAARAQSSAMDGLMVLPAMRYVSDRRETIAHFRAVAAASNLPVIVYNNPVAYGVDITPGMFAEMADEKKFVALKESSMDVRRVTDIMNLVGNRYVIFTGVDDLALESLMLGATGWIAGLVCAFPRETVAIYELARKGRVNEAREIYRWFMPLLHLDTEIKFVQNIKLVEHFARGTSPLCRPPRLELTGDEYARVKCLTETAMQSRPKLPI